MTEKSESAASNGLTPARSYGKPPAGERTGLPGGASGQTSARRERPPPTEIWVRGNPRPVIGLAIAGLVLAAALAAALVTVGGTMLPSRGVAAGSAAAVLLVVLAAAGLLLFGGLQPRLARRGGALVVRLQPLMAHEVPLEVVECVFPGSQPLPPRSHEPDADPGRRVGTIVIRLAERATAWRQRPTFSPWGTWEDGHIIIDGRWCQRLSPEFARGLGGRLVEAKRETHDTMTTTAMTKTAMTKTAMTERSA